LRPELAGGNLDASMRPGIVGLVLALFLLGTPGAARGQPASRPAPRPGAARPAAGDEPGAPAAPASRPGPPPAGARQFRFDALRSDGWLRGPAVLEVRATAGSRRPPPLLRLRGSLVRRIFESVEAPALHER
jgi:hypothetical protein